MKIAQIVSTGSELARFDDGDDTFARGSVALIDDNRGRWPHSSAAMVIWRMAGEERSPACEARANMMAASDVMLDALRLAERAINKQHAITLSRVRAAIRLAETGKP